MKQAIAIALGLIIAAVVLAQSGEPVVLTTANPNKVQPVSVTNFPGTQNVAGTVDVGNLPAVQQVAGTVAVSSLPALSQATRFQLVGFTAATFTGDQGVFVYTQACQIEFSGSRMCTLIEAIQTTNLPVLAVGTDTAWIEPVDVRPNSHNFARNCNGWSSDDDTGQTIDKSGRYVLRWCGGINSGGLPNSIACCAPV